ncbi:histone methyltransferase set2, partial [Ascosphaera acerosa]
MTLSNATIEALGLDDFDGTWDTAVVKKPRRKKADEGDEEYVDSVQPKELDEKAVVKVMASLRQVKEKWIAVKLLTRLQRATDERVCGQIARMHGYAILKQHLGHWHDDPNVVGQILDILDHFPRLSRNKIEASGIEASIQPLTESEDERVQKKAKYLLEEWSNLEMGYRIPKKKDGSAGGASTTAAGNAFNPFDRRDRGESDRDQRRSRSRSRSKSIEPPTGPRNPSKPSRNHHQYHPGPRQFRPGYGNPKHFHGHGGGPPPLPEGWFQHVDAQGRTYYYTRS